MANKFMMAIYESKNIPSVSISKHYFSLIFLTNFFSSSEAGSYIFWWVDLIINIALSHFFWTFLDF